MSNPVVYFEVAGENGEGLQKFYNVHGPGRQ